MFHVMGRSQQTVDVGIRGDAFGNRRLLVSAEETCRLSGWTAYSYHLFIIPISVIIRRYITIADETAKLNNLRMNHSSKSVNR